MNFYTYSNVNRNSQVKGVFESSPSNICWIIYWLSSVHFLWNVISSTGFAVCENLPEFHNTFFLNADNIFTNPPVSALTYQEELAEYFLKRACGFITPFPTWEGIGTYWELGWDGGLPPRIAGDHRHVVGFNISASVRKWSRFGDPVLHFTGVASTCTMCEKHLEIPSSTKCSTHPPNNILSDRDCQPFFLYSFHPIFVL